MGDIDHWIWAVPDLDAGNRAVRKRIGNSYYGGLLEGLGCANHIVPLHSGRYLEVLGPSELPGALGKPLATCEPHIAGFAIRVKDMDGVDRRARDLGFAVSGPDPYTRVGADGTPLHWRLLFIRGHNFGDYLPFFIDWLDSPHPSCVAPAQAGVESFAVTYPSADLASAYDALEIPLEVRSGPAWMKLTLRGPTGVEVFECPGASDLLGPLA